MDTLSAFAMGSAHRDNELMVFDWIKAAEIIKERKPQEAIAGLSSDMEWTSGEIWANGAPVPRDETYVFLASTWATPVIMIDYEEIDCYKMQSETPGWDSDTYWPQEALAVLGLASGEPENEGAPGTDGYFSFRD